MPEEKIKPQKKVRTINNSFPRKWSGVGYRHTECNGKKNGHEVRNFVQSTVHRRAGAGIHRGSGGGGTAVRERGFHETVSGLVRGKVWLRKVLADDELHGRTGDGGDAV